MSMLSTPTSAPASGTDQVAALNATTLYRFFRAGDEETLALKGVSLTVAAGEFVVVAGPSGSGKSTLLSCLAGLDEPDGGSVLVNGSRLSHQSEPRRARARAESIGLLLQSSNLFDHLTVTQNVVLAQRLLGASRPVDASELIASLGLATRAHARPDELSGGELARAGLAVALANDPAVLLADEPTGELDHVTEAQVLQLLSVRAAVGLAIVVASHSPAVAAAADRVVHLVDGKVTPDA
ncbi:ATP-binding cassette domain-containing protein [Jatrophihabitans telluris]|uniref:ATP-binding cassette domain-containing protein n=1 Tax=Jatrophihabitans telluris TaxID=2038343 RepID=A0ABY4QTC5_9ACTN|nr:ATP-binding cassette domain-containing protein [Jatrophihabitans telluris]UQX86623.1 ATP-binding cassette domain-containing protein [Jatrophihabitans telluris]